MFCKEIIAVNLTKLSVKKSSILIINLVVHILTIVLGF